MSSYTQKFKDKTCFSYCDQNLGDFTIWPLQIEKHAGIITQWVNKDYARFWGMSDLSESEVYSYYSQLLMQADKTAFIGYWQNQPAFLFELYDPALHPVREHYSVEEGIVVCTY